MHDIFHVALRRVKMEQKRLHHYSDLSYGMKDVLGTGVCDSDFESADYQVRKPVASVVGDVRLVVPSVSKPKTLDMASTMALSELIPSVEGTDISRFFTRKGKGSNTPDGRLDAALASNVFTSFKNLNKHALKFNQEASLPEFLKEYRARIVHWYAQVFDCLETPSSSSGKNSCKSVNSLFFAAVRLLDRCYSVCHTRYARESNKLEVESSSLESPKVSPCLERTAIAVLTLVLKALDSNLQSLQHFDYRIKTFITRSTVDRIPPKEVYAEEIAILNDLGWDICHSPSVCDYLPLFVSRSCDAFSVALARVNIKLIPRSTQISISSASTGISSSACSSSSSTSSLMNELGCQTTSTEFGIFPSNTFTKIQDNSNVQQQALLRAEGIASLASFICRASVYDRGSLDISPAALSAASLILSVIAVLHTPGIASVTDLFKDDKDVFDNQGYEEALQESNKFLTSCRPSNAASNHQTGTNEVVSSNMYQQLCSSIIKYVLAVIFADCSHANCSPLEVARACASQLRVWTLAASWASPQLNTLQHDMRRQVRSCCFKRFVKKGEHSVAMLSPPDALDVMHALPSEDVINEFYKWAAH